MALATRLTTPMRVLPWMRSARVRKISEQLDKAMPDVLYAVGVQAWSLAIDLGELLERPVVLDVCSIQQVISVPRPKRSPCIAGYVVSTSPIARLLEQRCERELVHLVPVGVSIPAEPSDILSEEDDSLSIAILGRSNDVRAYDAMLDGLARVLRPTMTVQVFLELRGRHEHDVWRRTERLELLRWVSAIGEASTYRTLLTECDLIVIPERIGEVRSIMLEAMAHGIPILAAHDPAVDLLQHEVTAWITTQPAAVEWQQQLERALNHRDMLKALGVSARRHIGEHHRSSAQVQALLQTLERAVSGGSFRLHPTIS